MEKGDIITNSLCYLSYPTGSQYSVCPLPRTDSGLKIKPNPARGEETQLMFE